MLALIALLIERPRPRPAAADPCLFAPQNKHDNKRASLSLSLSLSTLAFVRSHQKLNTIIVFVLDIQQSKAEERRGGEEGQPAN